MKRWLFVLFVSIVYAPSCFDDPAGIVCDTMAMAGITVQVTEAGCGLGIAEGACAWVQDGSFVDTLEYCGDDSLGNQLTLCGAWERPGTYSLTIEKDAYTTYHQENIEILDDVCHVKGVSLTVLMVRDISVVAEAFPDTIKYGESFDIHVTVKNHSSEEFVYHDAYTCSCKLHYYFFDENGVCIERHPRFCGAGFSTFKLEPFEAYEETVSFSYRSVTPGHYIIKTILTRGYKDEVEVIVVP